MEANYQVRLNEVVPELQHVCEEIPNETDQRKLGSLYVQRITDKSYKRAILAIDSNQKRYFILDNGQEMEMPYHNSWIRIQCCEPLKGLAIILSTFKLNLLDDEMREYNPFISKSEAIEFMKKASFCVADRNGYFYESRDKKSYTSDGSYIKDLPDGEYLPETILLRFWDIR